MKLTRLDVLRNILGDVYKCELQMPDFSLRKVDAERFSREARAYHDEQSRLAIRLEMDLAEACDLVDHPRANDLYNLAWRFGRDKGPDGIYSYYLAMVDLIKD